MGAPVAGVPSPRDALVLGRALTPEALMSRHAFLPIRFALTAGCTAFAVQALACECTAPLQLDLMVARSSTVFTGTVVAIQPSANPQYVLLTVTPALRWKGGLSSPMIIADPVTDGICMLHVTVGTEYLFFTDPFGVVGPAPETNCYVESCSGTAPTAANPFIGGLGTPLNPTPTLARSWGALKILWR
jgi:hypothetical protein